MSTRHPGWTIAAFVGVCVLVNGLIFAMGWQDQSSRGEGLLPPGWVIGLVWLLLFGGLGLAYWRLGRDAGDAQGRRRIVWLAAWCLAYPFYTAGLSSRTLGLAGSVATIVVALLLAAWLWRRERISAALVGAIAAWVVYATVGLALSP